MIQDENGENMIEDIEKKEIFKQWVHAVPRGWHNLFWDMLTCIQWYIDNHYPKWTYDIIEAKEKHNTLTIYDCCYDEDGNRKDVPEEIVNIVQLAFEKSKHICPICSGEKDYNSYEYMCKECEQQYRKWYNDKFRKILGGNHE